MENKKLGDLGASIVALVKMVIKKMVACYSNFL